MSRLPLSALALTLLIVAPASAEVTPIAQAMRGTMVTVAGTVDRLTDDDEFLMSDATGSLSVDIGPNKMPVGVGDKVEVSGFMDDDFGPKELYAQRIVRANGLVIELRYNDE